MLCAVQVDEEPSIRANTTVLLGNIAPSLGAAACRRILLNAFTRALKDIYAPSRTAALKALMATASYHSAQDVAARVVPSIAPLMLDASSDVRQVGCKVRPPPPLPVRCERTAAVPHSAALSPSSHRTQCPRSGRL